MENKYIKEAKKQFDELKSDEYERELAESRMIHLMDIKSIEESGYENGVKAGIKQGLEQGSELGEKKKSIEIAKKLLKKNINIEEIIELTGLSKEEIEKLNLLK